MFFIYVRIGIKSENIIADFSIVRNNVLLQLSKFWSEMAVFKMFHMPVVLRGYLPNKAAFNG